MLINAQRQLQQQIPLQKKREKRGREEEGRKKEG